jgi:Kef-type K+ transport system membrane component KefB
MLTEHILLQFIVIMLVVQLAGHLCRFIGQQWVIGEILAGLALGPSLLGALLPSIKDLIFPVSTLPTLQTLGDLGLVLYMFSLGARLDIHLMLHQSRRAFITSVSSILLPLFLGAGLALLLFPHFGGPKTTLLPFTLLTGTALAITAFPVLARFLTEKNMLHTSIGTLALTCAAIDDVTAWCLLALVVAVIHAQDLQSVVFTIGFTLLFITCMFTIVRPLLAYTAPHIRSKPFLATLSIILLLLSAYATNAIGIHPVFGAFIMGIILPRKTFFVELVRDVDRVNTLLFLPLFFVYSGLRTQIGLISNPWLWLICLLVLAIACVGKIFGGALAVLFMGDSWHDALSLGILMNTRGLVELIVLNLGLDLGVLSPTFFAMLVIMALVTTMITSPLFLLLSDKQRSLHGINKETQSSDTLQERIL